MPALARKLRFADYFALAFGTIDRKSTRLNSSHTVIYSLSLHDALPISPRRQSAFRTTLRPLNACPRAQTPLCRLLRARLWNDRSEEHTSELQSHRDLLSFPTRRSSDLSSPPICFSNYSASSKCLPSRANSALPITSRSPLER